MERSVINRTLLLLVFFIFYFLFLFLLIVAILVPECFTSSLSHARARRRTLW